MVHPAPDDFDAFYADTRQRLLLQTYALTGDLRASRTAVRHAFVVAWHQWPRVSRSEDPEGWVRPYAWRHARRRHTARLWHRARGLEEDAAATLAALGALPAIQRRLLLLAHLADVSMDGLAREVALPRELAERELQTASATFAVERGLPSTDVRAAIEQLDPVVAEERWPRASLLRRAGAARRRTHTAAGMAGAVVALVVAGTVVVSQGPGSGQVRPTLETEPLTEPAAPPSPSLGPDDLVTVGQVQRALPGAWRSRGGGDNTGGNGLVVRCQQERFADPDGSAAAVRRFVTRKGRGPRATAVQLSELSDRPAAAREAFRTTTRWYAGCTEPATRLVRTQKLATIGDRAWLFQLRGFRPDTMTTVAVARSGLFTHTVAHTVHAASRSRPRPVVALLAEAVDARCGQPGAGPCAGIPRGEDRRPLPVPPAPAMLAEFDLPPVAGVPRPWVGTEPAAASVNTAATPCDETSFRGLRGNRTRTFLTPNANVPDAFGLTESIARFPKARGARSFVSRVRTKLGNCPGDDGASEVRTLARASGGGRELAVWQVATEVSDARSVRYLMAIVRRGRAVAQVGFVPAGDRTISNRDFVQLARRAQERLAFAGAGDEGSGNAKKDKGNAKKDKGNAKKRQRNSGNRGSGGNNSGN